MAVKSTTTCSSGNQSRQPKVLTEPPYLLQPYRTTRALCLIVGFRPLGLTVYQLHAPTHTLGLSATFDDRLKLKSTTLSDGGTQIAAQHKAASSPVLLCGIRTADDLSLSRQNWVQYSRHKLPRTEAP